MLNMMAIITASTMTPTLIQSLFFVLLVSV
jgi:hypothetical protein